MRVERRWFLMWLMDRSAHVDGSCSVRFVVAEMCAEAGALQVVADFPAVHA